MRKLLVSLSVVVLVCVSSVSARGLFVASEENPNFVDEDGDGICDNVSGQKHENAKHNHGRRNSAMNKIKNK